jgi:multicomponent Na+:H+ antiporter subunit G
MIYEVLEVVLISLGLLFLLLASVGINKFPDLYTRMAAGSKATTLGMLGLIMGAIVAPHSEGYRASLSLGILFILIVAPTASHLLGRAAYRAGVKPWSKTTPNQFK